VRGGAFEGYRMSASRRVLTIGFTAALLYIAAPAPAQEQEFHHVFDNSKLDVSAKPGEQFTDAVKEFHRSGQNPYNGKREAVDEGKKLYDEICAACHMPDGSGGMGAKLSGPQYVYPRVTTDKGLFEVVFGGAAGAMQPFGQRMTQDQILKAMAYVRTLMSK
jgi:cytochrome c-L